MLTKSTVDSLLELEPKVSLDFVQGSNAKWVGGAEKTSPDLLPLVSPGPWPCQEHLDVALSDLFGCGGRSTANGFEAFLVKRHSD